MHLSFLRIRLHSYRSNGNEVHHIQESFNGTYKCIEESYIHQNKNHGKLKQKNNSVHKLKTFIVSIEVNKVTFEWQPQKLTSFNFNFDILRVLMKVL